MKHAFLITAYKDPEQLYILIDELKKYNSNIYIHIDKRSAQLKKDAALKYSPTENVHIISDSIKVHFGGFSHLKAILILLDEAYKNSDNFYFHLISGQDLPIKSKKEFELFFEKNRDNNFITNFKLPDKNWSNGGLDRMEHYHLNDLFDPKKDLFLPLSRRFINLQNRLKIKRKQPNYINSYYGGGTWWSLSLNAINTVMAFIKKHPDFIRFFKHTHCGEEIFFQTILMNGEIKSQIINDDLRYINWNTKHGSCPALLDLDDKENIFKKEYMFARKFDSKMSAGLRREVLSP